MGCRRVTGMRWATVLVAAVLTIGIVGSSDAAEISNLFPTGFDRTAGTAGNIPLDTQDYKWKVAAWAAGGTFQPGYEPMGTSPYDAYVFQSNVDQPLGIPNSWVGGTANNGLAAGLWIGLQNDAIGIINTPPSTYPGDFRSSMVLSTTFQADSTGVALLDFWAAADNVVAFFVGGTVTTSTNVIVGDISNGLTPGWQLTSTGSNFPTIEGGQQIGFGRGFGQLTHYTAYANVTAGPNTLYAVVYDAVSGSSNSTGFLLTPVPEPSSVVLAGIAVGCLAYSHQRSQRRRRLRSAGKAPSADGSPSAGG